MGMQEFELVIIGGGAAGLVAAITAKEAGINNILILERENSLGGTLNEYIHNGFGLNQFKEELTGTEYAQRLIDEVNKLKIAFKLDTIVLDLNRDKVITFMNSKDGVASIKAKAIILATGCRERPRGAMSIPKSRCSGIYTAGSVQRFVNKEGYLPGKNVVIMGSGDMGAIIARRLIVESAKVQAVVEYMPYVSAADRNILQCFQGFNIPLLLSHTVTEIKGSDRVEGVIVAEVDEHKKVIPGTEQEIPCDCLVLSIGLYPENELASKAQIAVSPITKGPMVDDNMETSMEGVFACGCVLHVHNLVDHVACEAAIAARSAANYLKGISYKSNSISIEASSGIKYTVPMYVSGKRLKEDLIIHFKVDNIYEDKHLAVYFGNNKVASFKKSRFSVGNMECIRLSMDLIAEQADFRKITIKLEDI